MFDWRMEDLPSRFLTHVAGKLALAISKQPNQTCEPNTLSLFMGCSGFLKVRWLNSRGTRQKLKGLFKPRLGSHSMSLHSIYENSHKFGQIRGGRDLDSSLDKGVAKS